MNGMNDERFFDLAMKAIARQSSEAERKELEALLASHPERKAEFERLRTAARLANEALPLVDATEATAGELPAYARGRLQTKVRQTLGRPAEPEAAREQTAREFAWGLRWLLGLATVTVLLVLLLVPTFTQSNKLVVQVAMLDTAGGTRGTDTNEVAILQRMLETTSIQSFTQSRELEAWEKSWPATDKRPAAKIIYDRAAGEVRVLGRWEGKPFQKTFLVEPDLASALRQANAFIREQTRH